MTDELGKFLHNKTYDESTHWKNNTIYYQSVELKCIYSDGDNYGDFGDYTFDKLKRYLTEYPVQKNIELLKELKEKFPEEFI